MADERQSTQDRRRFLKAGGALAAGLLMPAAGMASTEEAAQTSLSPLLLLDRLGSPGSSPSSRKLNG